MSETPGGMQCRGKPNNYNPVDLIMGLKTPENNKSIGSMQLKMGEIKNVPNDYGTDRTVDVVTWDDRRYPQCTLMDPFGSPDGAGFEAAPVKGAICIVGEMEGYKPIILGFSKLVNEKTGKVAYDENDELEPLLPGDYRFKTVANNYIHLHSGGAIRVQANDNCRTWYLPQQFLVRHESQNYEVITGAGIETWRVVKEETGECLWTKKIKRNKSKGKFPVLNMFAGRVDKKGTIFNMNFGDGENEQGKGDLNIYEDGTILLAFKENGSYIQWQNTEQRLDIKTPGGTAQLKKDGSFSLALGAGSLKASLAYNASDDFLVLSHKGLGQQLKMDDKGMILSDKNGNSMTMKKDAIVFQSKNIILNGQSVTLNAAGVFVGKKGAMSNGYGVVTGFPDGSHPQDYWTGLPIFGLGSFGAG